MGIYIYISMLSIQYHEFAENCASTDAHYMVLFNIQLLTLWCEGLAEGLESATHQNLLKICTTPKVNGNNTQFQQMDKYTSEI